MQYNHVIITAKPNSDAENSDPTGYVSVSRGDHHRAIPPNWNRKSNATP